MPHISGFETADELRRKNWGPEEDSNLHALASAAT